MKIKRGDTKKYKFQRKDANGQPILTIANKIYFSVKKSDQDNDVIIQKTIEDMTFDEQGYYHFTIEPTDTNNLKYGTYCYDIERIVEGDVLTIAMGKFQITSEITFARNEV